MKVKRITLEGFRGYRKKTSLNVSDFTVLIGKNDAGKSTWLDALAVFFNTGKADKDDSNVFIDDNQFSIEVSFEAPTRIVIDSRNQIDPKKEYLLDSNGDLTIRKVFANATIKEVLLRTYYPDVSLLDELFLKKIDDLKRMALDELEIPESQITKNKSMSATWREAIREKLRQSEGDFNFIDIDINLSDERDKEKRNIYKKIEEKFPIYSHFQVDRQNIDSDEEVQDPLKDAIRLIMSTPQVQKMRDDLSSKVKKEYIKVANDMITELKKLNPTLAGEVIPDFRQPSFNSLFRASIKTDNDVPLNKRGSGVRRLLLMSFFMSKAIKELSQESREQIIYGIEEPETSQHPEHQITLIGSLKKIAAEPTSQVIITTHSPQLVHEIDFQSIRYIKNKKKDESRIVEGKDILDEVIADMGTLPSINAGLLFCVEGKNDVATINNFSKNIFGDIISSKDVPIFPLHGGNAEKWVTEEYLRNTEVKEVHLYDRDTDHRYKKLVKVVNKWRTRKCKAFLTNKHELENYIHPKLINKEFGTEFIYDSEWDDLDIPETIAVQVYGLRKSEKGQFDKKVSEIKKTINYKLSDKMTEDLLKEINGYHEAEEWFKVLV